MNDELKDQLAKVIERSMQLAEKTGEFILDQAPELLQEFYRWHLWQNAIATGLTFILSAIGVYIFIQRVKAVIKHNGDEFDIALAFVTFVLAFIPSVFFIFNLLDLIKIIVAPKLYLIEYLL